MVGQQVVRVCRLQWLLWAVVHHDGAKSYRRGVRVFSKHPVHELLEAKLRRSLSQLLLGHRIHCEVLVHIYLSHVR